MTMIKQWISQYIGLVFLFCVLTVGGYFWYLKNEVNTLTLELKSVKIQLADKDDKLIQSQASVKGLMKDIDIQNKSIIAASKKSTDLLEKQSKDLQKAKQDSLMYQYRATDLMKFQFTGNDCEDVHNLLKDLGND